MYADLNWKKTAHAELGAEKYDLANIKTLRFFTPERSGIKLKNGLSTYEHN